MVRLLDCTLRDGGYLNNWTFGHDNIIAIFERLVSAGIDIVEIGFIDARQPFDLDRTIQPGSEKLGAVYTDIDTKDAMIVGMIDYGTCPIENIQPCGQSIMDGIRIIFKKEKMYDAISFCRQIKELGYQVFAQAVSITSYSDDELDELLCLVNELEPYAFSLVDTYGLLHKGQLKHYFDRADQKLNPGIGLGYHSHNNFQLGYANCIELLETPIERDVIVDGSLYGMGKSAGNTPIELLATYMNEMLGKSYQIYQLLEALDETILDIYKTVSWGYSFQYFLSASNDCHPNYVSYLAEKKKLSVKSINEILGKLKEEKKLNYDEHYVERLYIEHQKNDCEDKEAYAQLRQIIGQRPILLIGPGPKAEQQQESVKEYIRNVNPCVIAVNYIPRTIPIHYLFLSNAKRYIQQAAKLGKIENNIQIIATSNITKTSGDFKFTFNYASLLDEEALIVDNPMIMLIKILDRIGVGEIGLAGFDGYVQKESANYIRPDMEHSFSRRKAKEINADVVESLARLTINSNLHYVTESLYNGSVQEASRADAEQIRVK